MRSLRRWRLGRRSRAGLLRAAPGGAAERTVAPADPDVDVIALVHGWMGRLCNEAVAAESLTEQVVRQYYRGEEPSWLAHRNLATRLQYLAVRAVLAQRDH